MLANADWHAMHLGGLATFVPFPSTMEEYVTVAASMPKISDGCQLLPKVKLPATLLLHSVQLQ